MPRKKKTTRKKVTQKKAVKKKITNTRKKTARKKTTTKKRVTKKTTTPKRVKKAVKKTTKVSNTKKRVTKEPSQKKKATFSKKIAAKKPVTHKKILKTKKKVVKTEFFKQEPVLEQTLPKSTNPGQIIQNQKVPISPYVLDIKKIEQEKRLNKVAEEKDALRITRELFSRFNFPKNNSIKKQEPVYHQPKAEKISLPAFKIKSNFKLPQIKIKEIRLGQLIIPNYWYKTLTAFMIFCFLFISPFFAYDHYQQLKTKKDSIIGQATNALWHLGISQKAAAASDLYYTQFELEQAAMEFKQAKNSLQEIDIITKNLVKIIPQVNKQFKAAQNLVDIGEKLSNSAALVTKALNSLTFNNSIDSLNLTNKIVILKDNLSIILPDIKTANQEIQEIEVDQLPEEYQEKVAQLQTILPQMEANLENFLPLTDLLLDILGQETKRRYLVVFQNNHEIRATGGFIGSYALVDIDQGNVSKINIPGGGPYDLHAGLKVNIEAPQPLQLINPRWEFQDANWFADLPTSAEKMSWFYEKSGGPTVDGIIFVNATFLENILTVLGPISLPQYNKIITADNYFEQLQWGVEVEYDKDINQPKEIIAGLTSEIINKLLTSDKKQFTQLLDLSLTGLNQKEIQLYFKNYNLEKFVLDNNWGGALRENDDDYLNIISTNIAGEKTDAKIKQKADLVVEVQPDGTIINKLYITKTHLGQPGEKFYGVDNIDYLRTYVPKDSQLLKAEGFDNLAPEMFMIPDPQIYQKDPDLAFSLATKRIDKDSQTEIYNINDKTVFANWIILEPGQTKTVYLEYQLPFALNLDKDSAENLEKYTLLLQKQSGKDIDLNVDIKFPQNLTYQLSYPADLNKNNNVFSYKTLLETDKFIAIIFDQQ